MSERETERAGKGGQGEEAEERNAGAERLVDRQDSPDKRHGDALRDGSGSRHGVDRRDAEPDTCA